MKKKKVIIIGALLLGGALIYAATRRRRPAYVTGDGSVTIGSVECIDGDCDGAPASESWLSSSAPSQFLDFDSVPSWLR